MPFFLVLLTAILSHTAFKGTRVLVALDALALGANPALLGVLFALFAVLPVFLALPAGRFADRVGSRRPMLIGTAGLATGLVACYVLPGLPTLFVAVAAIGGCYVFYTVSIQMLVGSLGAAEGRTRRYGHFSLAIAATAMLGPVVAGLANAFSQRKLIPQNRCSAAFTSCRTKSLLPKIRSSPFSSTFAPLGLHR